MAIKKECPVCSGTGKIACPLHDGKEYMYLCWVCEATGAARDASLLNLDGFTEEVQDLIRQQYVLGYSVLFDMKRGSRLSKADLWQGPSPNWSQAATAQGKTPLAALKAVIEKR